ncbi:hypothetical protein G7Y89_g1606 [Cudoniella acicularis]|uniref:Uncharacterized protein n=1 Tax=Cudoniella acicularis TaxID=354080 RepID=A0A8H4RWV7_9HELO|nr:hypothetical protein G7Y89_g1606 [Cudoniella acicularis]
MAVDNASTTGTHPHFQNDQPKKVIESRTSDVENENTLVITDSDDEDETEISSIHEDSLRIDDLPSDIFSFINTIMPNNNLSLVKDGGDRIPERNYTTLRLISIDESVGNLQFAELTNPLIGRFKSGSTPIFSLSYYFASTMHLAAEICRQFEQNHHKDTEKWKGINFQVTLLENETYRTTSLWYYELLYLAPRNPHPHKSSYHTFRPLTKVHDKWVTLLKGQLHRDFMMGICGDDRIISSTFDGIPELFEEKTAKETLS